MPRNRARSVQGSLKSLRSEAVALFREQNAILVLANHPGRFRPTEVESHNSRIETINSARELKALISQLRLAVSQMRSQFEVRATREQLLQFMVWIDRNCQPGQACYLPLGNVVNIPGIVR